MDKDTLERLRARASQHFLDSIAVKQEAEKILPEQVARGIVAMTDCLRSGGKVMACGNGGSAADAQHFAAELIGRFERERQELAAIALTTDILIGISTSGNSKNVVKAIEAAKKLGIKIIALTGNGGGKIASLLNADDIHLCAPSTRTARIQETHLVLLHALCDGVDHLLLD